ncbi:unnamed protein product, partial [Rotaria sordida]
MTILANSYLGGSTSYVRVNPERIKEIVLTNKYDSSSARDNRFKSIEMYTEVIQDSIFDLINSDKLRFASTTALTFSSEGQKRFHRDLYELKSK